MLDAERASAPHTAPGEELLREALTGRQTRRIRTDGTLDVADRDFELEQGFLAGHKVWSGPEKVDGGLGSSRGQLEA